ncbi:MAG TPA: nucleoside hydrolase [Micromonosporaceae bacterium]|nr:nucleoside hydrolase [Micromonosporaceae bacterium]
MSDDSWRRLEAERTELAERAERFADLGLGTHAELLRAGGPIPPKLTGTPMIVDTDVGGDPDDAIALIVAARNAPELALVLTGDEVDGERARFARHLLDLAGRPEVPVVAGRQLPGTAIFCAEDLTPRDIGPQPTDVAAAVARACLATDGPVRWVGMGPLSNLADVLRERPELATRLALTQMGGALRYRDPSRAEHNFRRDPAAVPEVLEAVPRTWLVTSDVTFSTEIEIDARSTLYRWLSDPTAPPWARPLVTHLDRWFERYHPGSMQHDALTLSAAMQLPFVDFDLVTVALAPDARMAEAPAGVRLYASRRAQYAGFRRWLSTALGVSDPAAMLRH